MPKSIAQTSTTGAKLSTRENDCYISSVQFEQFDMITVVSVLKKAAEKYNSEMQHGRKREIIITHTP